VLLLMPAGVLVVLILGAIAVDAAIAFLGERELADLTAAAAGDAAVLALRPAEYYRCGALVLDQEQAGRVARDVALRRGTDAVEVDRIDAVISTGGPAPTVTVLASGTVELIFTPALPGRSGRRTVSARSTVAATPSGGGTGDGAC
jgi:hypothetical protein